DVYKRQVLARGAGGYRRLSSAIGTAHLDAGIQGAAHYDLEDLGGQAHGEWLVLTGCRKGAVRRALTGPGTPTDRLAAARHELDTLTATFGHDNVAVEITATGDPRDSALHDALALLATQARLPLVATTAAHHARPSDADLAAALAAVRARSSLDDLDGWLPGAPTAHLRSGTEMARLHARHPEAVPNAARLGAECAFDLDLIAPDLPPHPVPDGHDEASWLRVLTERGAVRYYGTRAENPDAWAVIDRELRIITELNFPGYFLVVHDLVEFCRSRGILCQGRGSAANSAVCYALGITAVDAVRHGLLFERFLAPERDGPPDIDLDIESVRREEVIQYVYDRFGRTHAAQVANVITYRPRSAVRDASRALGYDAGQADAWAKGIERWGSLKPGPGPGRAASRAEDAHDTVPYQAPPSAAEEGEIPAAVIDLADRMLRLPRHLGIHSGGMVMCDRPVIEVCPVQWARMAGRTVLQWDKEDCADAGLVKFDLLGLGMLTAIRYALESIAEHTGEHLTLHDLPPEDERVYDLLCDADTVGVFQVESRAQMATLPRLRPRRFYDIVIEVALIRPGPIQGGSVHPYIERARGRQPVTFAHPLLEKSLARTKGVPLFQEQLMQMAIDVAGFTPAESDQLRRAMGSKRSVERMEALRARLHAGMADRGVPPAVRDEIYDKLKAFADFGFPESHAYSFAYLVYASAWLKVHHPAAFYAGLLAAQPMGFYSPQSLVADARRHGVRVLRPDVNASRPLTGVERTEVERTGVERADDGDPAGPALAVRMGLAEVKGIGKELAQEIVAARGTSSGDGSSPGRFADVRDLVRRVELSTAQIEALATAGALESLGLTRREALWAAGALGQELSLIHI
ncbi:error-prone DNA polymerase, partial [Myceligenerans indicum]